MGSLEEKQQECDQLQGKSKELKDRKEAVSTKNQVILAKLQEAKARLATLDSTKETCEMLTRLEAELEDKVATARKRIHDMELSRMEQQARRGLASNAASALEPPRRCRGICCFGSEGRTSSS